jgi:[ribosomal protein S5]-alanine N-acetyltransferase
MQDNVDITLETKRLILREFREDDGRDVQELGEEDAESFIKTILAQKKQEPRVSYQFALVNKPDEKLIGHFGIYIKSIENKEGEIGYSMNPSYQKRGYMTEAARKLVSFGFTQLGLHRIFAVCDTDNIASYRVMEKSGMRREGCLREHEIHNGVWRDYVLYSILKQEWQKARKNSSKLKEKIY